MLNIVQMFGFSKTFEVLGCLLIVVLLGLIIKNVPYITSSQLINILLSVNPVAKHDVPLALA